MEALIEERKGKGGELWVLVKWTGYADPQWIKVSDVLPGNLQRLRVEKGLRARTKRGRLAPAPASSEPGRSRAAGMIPGYPTGVQTQYLLFMWSFTQ